MTSSARSPPGSLAITHNISILRFQPAFPRYFLKIDCGEIHSSPVADELCSSGLALAPILVRAAEPLGCDRAANFVYGHIYACMLFYMPMRRTALFLKEQQLDKLQKLSDKTGAPVAELVRRAIDAYLLSRKKEIK